MLIDLVLPYPPTVNTYWRRRGSTYFVSKAGERYRRAVALIVRQQRLKLSLSGRLAIKIIAEPPDKRRRDLDNILKAPLDALTQTCRHRDQKPASGYFVAHAGHMPSQLLWVH